MRQLHIEFVFTAAIGVTFDGDVSDVRVIDEKLSDLVEQIERFGLDDGLRRLEEDLFFDVDLAFGELDFGVGIGVGATVFVFEIVEIFGFFGSSEPCRLNAPFGARLSSASHSRLR